MKLTKELLQSEMYRRFGLVMLEDADLNNWFEWIKYHTQPVLSDYDQRMQQLRDLGLA